MPRFLNYNPEPVTVEYDSRGKRVSKSFTDHNAAKRFYVAKDKDGKRPKVRNGSSPTPARKDSTIMVTKSKAKPKAKVQSKVKHRGEPDKFGAGSNTISATINAAIPTRGAITVESLIEKLAKRKVTSARVRAHIVHLRSRGWILFNKKTKEVKAKAKK